MTLPLMTFFSKKIIKNSLQSAVSTAIDTVGIHNIKSGEDVEKIISLINQFANQLENEKINPSHRFR